MTSKLNDIAFLFGSGISIPAKLPSVEKISEVILDENNCFFKDSDGVFRKCRNENNSFNSDKNSIVKKLIENIRRVMGVSVFNYEELAEKLYTLDVQNNEFNLNIEEIADTINYIHSIVQSMLSQNYNLNKKYFGELKWLRELILKFKISDVFTLNHDLLLEEFFKKNGIKFTDGFFDEDRFCKAHEFNVNKLKASVDLKYIKIHGSINWKEFSIDDENYSMLKCDGIRAKNKNGKTFYPSIRSNWLSYILIGVERKVGLYNTPNVIFHDLFEYFKCQLNKKNFLIVSGYGFRDNGINKVITEWYDLGSKKLVVFDKYFDNLNQLNFKNSSSKVIRKEKFIEEVSIKDFEDLFKQ